MKFFFGVISKNQVDTIIDFSLTNPNIEITFIPSRRQIEFNGGYVNNWTTRTFAEYVKTLNPHIKIERDHGGPGQGTVDDDGFASLEEDCKYFDIMHIDSWKKYPELNEGIEWTIRMIEFCYNLNPNIEYEIGTEEAIRPFTTEELETIIKTLKENLDSKIYDKIKYCVVQCGNALCNGKNSDIFDEKRLAEMLKLVKTYNFVSKEHNGDWVSKSTMKQKQKLGLECINIAPEFGEIESRVILNTIKGNREHYIDTYNMCINSGKWKKWVSVDFDYCKNQDEIILITCHYIYTMPEFINIKNSYFNIDLFIKSTVHNKLLNLYFTN